MQGLFSSSLFYTSLSSYFSIFYEKCKSLLYTQSHVISLQIGYNPVSIGRKKKWVEQS